VLKLKTEKSLVVAATLLAPEAHTSSQQKAGGGIAGCGVNLGTSWPGLRIARSGRVNGSAAALSALCKELSLGNKPITGNIAHSFLSRMKNRKLSFLQLRVGRDVM
jgi:hypothetical protein